MCFTATGSLTTAVPVPAGQVSNHKLLWSQSLSTPSKHKIREYYSIVLTRLSIGGCAVKRRGCAVSFNAMARRLWAHRCKDCGFSPGSTGAAGRRPQAPQATRAVIFHRMERGANCPWVNPALQQLLKEDGAPCHPPAPDATGPGVLTRRATSGPDEEAPAAPLSTGSPSGGAMRAA